VKQVIRIIGGIYRGKKIHFPLVEGLRPTPDRVKETLFNWLMNDIRGAHCLDAFAGSGSLGLEAFSRGAAQVIFVEQSSAAHNNLKKIITQFNSPVLKLIRADALNYLHHCREQYDVIFLDPPFAANLIPQCLTDIVSNNLLTTGGLLYLESPTPIDLDLNQWKSHRVKQSGQVIYSLFEKL
jgi:16S rRNA (guanine966-N2)-methyltransferase